MEGIADVSWMAHLAGGKVLERFEVNGYAAMAIRVGSGPTAGTYRYRLLFTEGAERHPVYAINLEASILGAWMITEQIGSGHRVVERVPGALAYETFRVKALERAIVALDQKI